MKKKIINKQEKNQIKSNEFILQNKVKFEVFGHEMIEKQVNSSGNSGRVYLPPAWIGAKVKIIKL